MNECGLYKKHISWDNELYYTLSKGLWGYSNYKNYLPLQGKIINETNCGHGYLTIKTRAALKKIRDNKEMICIPTRLLKNHLVLNDVVNMINAALAENASITPSRRQMGASPADAMTGQRL